MNIEMIINVSEGEESRVAVVCDNVLEELHIERAGTTSLVGNIYKAKVVNIEPAIQAAFIDFGVVKNGFLHISDLHPRYYTGHKETEENIGRRKSVTQRPLIQRCLKRGQDLIVQVIKEGINTKGPTLTTYLSLPGKYMVLMPWMNNVGVSQKIEDESERKRLREAANGLKLPDNAGIIVRTAALTATKRDLQNDLSYLSRLWGAITKRMDKEKAPAEMYRESDLVLRTVRDIFDTRISKIVCDNETIAKQIRDFVSIVQPKLKNRVSFYDQKTPLFHKYNIEKEIENIQSSRVELKCGGSLVIEQTEAMVTIDVNSGKYRKPDNAEQTALKINLEAAKEIVRQLKLRDMGGLIVCDFIDMRENKNKQAVERVFRDELKSDRARTRALKMSAFGLIELTRQRLRPSLQSSTTYRCPHCHGTGTVKSPAAQATEILRSVRMALSREEIRRVEATVAAPVAEYLLNQRRSNLAELEQESGVQIVIKSDFTAGSQSLQMVCYDERGSVVKL
ncbi:MAG: Rne/Rng family ribonuclease [Sedimentisphaerales bacterium]|nr:Rne/Rng family ribonuclease [Sedimentisphaerales bacterium]